MDSIQSTIKEQNIYIPLVVTGIISGLILSWGLLSGDESGRINLLYILLLYFFIPVVTLFATLISVIRRKSGNVLGRLLHTSLYNIQQYPYFRRLRANNLEQLWLIQQVQLFAMVFALASLVTFFFLLLFTDVSIVWRSTLLDPEDLYPLMSLIATPWSFWGDAQPNIQLLQATQDFRLQQEAINPVALASWWPFVVAVQIVYGILPRCVIYLLLKITLANRDTKEDFASIKPCESTTNVKETDSVRLSDVSESLEMIAWDFVPLVLLDKISTQYSAISNVQSLNWTPDMGDLFSTLDDVKPLIVVKSWEAPMAELTDYLKNNSGYVLPINWQGQQLIDPLDIHFEEWGRFSKDVGWQLVKLDDAIYV